MKASVKLTSVFASAVLALGATAIRADETPAPSTPAAETAKTETPLPHRLEHRLKQLDESLKLSPDQKTRIVAIWTKAEEQMREARQSLETATRQARRQKRGEILQGAHDQVRALLTPEQQKAFDSLPPPMRRRGKPAAES